VPAEVTTWFGADVTTLARTVVDLARHSRRDGLVAADAALREHLVTPEDLGKALTTAVGWPGVRAAREVVRLASPLAESPLESLVRLALHDDGFPPPQLQVRIAWYRVDFAWPRQRVIIEADGRVKYSGDELWREKRREHELRRRGYTVIRVLWTDVLTGWPVIRQMLAAALASPSPLM
jgi:very-short-patch-repair endonuclease